MKLVSVVLLIACFAGLFDYSTGNASKKCTEDNDCAEETVFCIENCCYPKVEYGSLCDHPRQCYQVNQTCSNSKCQCISDNKRLRNNCVSDDSCDTKWDCRRNQYCSRNRCYTRKKFWSVAEITGLSIGILIVIIVPLAVVKMRSRQER